MNIGHIILSVCILILFACAPTKVKIYPRETPPAKPMPEKTSSESISKEKTFSEKTPSQKDTSEEGALKKPPSEKTPTEKIPTVTPFLEKTYDETVSEWKSYQDLAKWMEDNFSVDPYDSLEEYKEFYEKHNSTKKVIEGIIYLQ